MRSKTVEDRIIELTKRLENYEKEIEEEKRILLELAKALKTESGPPKENEKLSELKKLISLHEKINQLSQLNADYAKTIQNLNQKIDALKKEIDQKNKLIEELQNLKTKLSEEIEKKDTALRNVQNYINKIEEDQKRIIYQLNQELQTTLSTLEKEKTEKNASLEKLNIEIEKLKTKITLLENENKELNQQILNLKMEKEKLESQTKELKQKLISERNEFLVTLEAEKRTHEIEKETILKQVTKEYLNLRERANLLTTTFEEQLDVISKLLAKNKSQIDQLYEAIKQLKNENDQRNLDFIEIVEEIKNASKIVRSAITEEEELMKSMQKKMPKKSKVEEVIAEESKI
ncbi:MAG: hypothetical protein QW524_01225 [Candidatus Woesearchaeota archaeon]